MKYYDELSVLENQIIRFSSIRSLMTVIAESSENCNRDDISRSLWFIENTVDDICEKSSQRFQELWNVIRDDSWTNRVEYKTPEHETSSNENIQLDDIVNAWIRK